MAMSDFAIGVSIVLLATAVGLVWVCVVAMLRTADAFARLHFPGAAVLVGPPAAAVALNMAEGLTATSARAWLIFAVLLLTNGILAHARTEWLRRRSDAERSDEARG
jgi:multisubunit Na+/H+ antiporter MnhG subunit